MNLYAFPLLLLLLQVPTQASNPQLTPPRQIGRFYSETMKETRIWIRIVPECPGYESPMVELIFEAYFSGPAKKTYSGRLKDPKGPPERVTLRALPWPRTVIRKLSLQINIDGNVFDLMALGMKYKTIALCRPDQNCSDTAVESELGPQTLRSLVSASTVGGEVLGFPVRFTQADQAALSEFAKRLSLFKSD